MGRRCEVSLDVGALYPGGSVADWPRVLVRGSLPDEMFDADGAHPARADGGDVWASLDGTVDTRVPVDLVFFSTDDDPANGTAEVWVRLPEDETESVWIHWGGAQAAQPARGSTFGGNAVWSNSFGAVYRFWNPPGATVEDRTGNGRTLAVGGSGQVRQTGGSGHLDPWWDLDSASTQTGSAWLAALTDTYTISAQVVGLDADVDEKIFGESGSGNWVYAYRSSGTEQTLIFYLRSSGDEDYIISTNEFSADVPNVFDFIRSGSNFEIRVNGESVETGTGSISGTYATSTMGVLSDDVVTFQGWRGNASLVTIATAVRNGAWTEAWALMLDDPEAHLMAGTPEHYDEPGFCGWWAGLANQVMGRRQG